MLPNYLRECHVRCLAAYKSRAKTQITLASAHGLAIQVLTSWLMADKRASISHVCLDIFGKLYIILERNVTGEGCSKIGQPMCVPLA